MKKTFEGFGTHESDPDEGEAEKGDNWNATQVLLAVDRDLDGKMNLAEYLMMRRAIIAWHECAQETMNRAGLRCSLSLITNDHRNVDQSEADAVFLIASSLQDNKNGLSFPVFLMIADLFRTFSAFDIPADNGYINQRTLIRSLNESDLPHRISEPAAKAIFAATGQEEINFATFCFAVITYNRWFMYSRTLGKPNFLNLDEFLALMHDSLVPDYVRKAVDGLAVNIPDDQLAWAMQKLVAGGGNSGAASFNVTPAGQKDEEEVKPVE